MKIRLALALVGLVISSAVPALAQEQNTVDPEVRRQIEAVQLKFDEAYNEGDAVALAALFTQDAIEGVAGHAGTWYGFGEQAIEKRWAGEIASSPSHVSKLVQVFAIGTDVCAINEYSTGSAGHKGSSVTIYVREGGTWKIRMVYAN